MPSGIATMAVAAINDGQKYTSPLISSVGTPALMFRDALSVTNVTE